MATLKQMLANRRNAKKSCGPKSQETKAAVSKNSVKHGLCGDFRVLAIDSQEAFDELLAQFRRDTKPVDSVEEELVLKMARHTWMSNRAIRLQQACFLVDAPDTPEQEAAGAKGVSVRKDLELHIRYQVQNDRAYQRAAKELRDYRKQKELAEIGFARKKDQNAAEQRRVNHETHLESIRKTAAAMSDLAHRASAARCACSEERLKQSKLRTAFLEDKFSRSQHRNEPLTNSESGTYMPATAALIK